MDADLLQLTMLVYDAHKLADALETRRSAGNMPASLVAPMALVRDAIRTAERSVWALRNEWEKLNPPSAAGGGHGS